jgi:hypothetical protein
MTLVRTRRGHPRWVATHPEPASRACGRMQTHVIYTPGGDNAGIPRVGDASSCLPPDIQPIRPPPEYGPRYHRRPQTPARIPH